MFSTKEDAFTRGSGAERTREEGEEEETGAGHSVHDGIIVRRILEKEAAGATSAGSKKKATRRD